MDTSNEFLSVPEVATLTRLSEPFWRKAIFRRQIPVLKIGRRVVIRRADLDKWLEQRLVPATAFDCATCDPQRRGVCDGLERNRGREHKKECIRDMGEADVLALQVRESLSRAIDRLDRRAMMTPRS